jgi:hypothetical protein
MKSNAIIFIFLNILLWFAQNVYASEYTEKLEHYRVWCEKQTNSYWDKRGQSCRCDVGFKNERDCMAPVGIKPEQTLEEAPGIPQKLDVDNDSTRAINKNEICESKLSGFFSDFNIPGENTKTIDILNNWSAATDDQVDKVKQLLQKQIVASGYKSFKDEDYINLKVSFHSPDVINVFGQGGSLQIMPDGSVKMMSIDGGSSLASELSTTTLKGEALQLKIKGLLNQNLPNQFESDRIHFKKSNNTSSLGYIIINNSTDSNLRLTVLPQGQITFGEDNLVSGNSSIGTGLIYCAQKNSNNHAKPSLPSHSTK